MNSLHHFSLIELMFFQHHRFLRHPNQMTFGDLSPTGTAGFESDIAYFCCHKGESMSESTILTFRRSLVDYCGVTHGAF